MRARSSSSTSPCPFPWRCSPARSWPALIALPVGYLSTRATGIYFAMLTLAFAQLLYTIAYKWRDLTGGSDGIAGVPKTTLWWSGPSLASPTAYYYLVAGSLVLSLFVCRGLVRSPFGRALMAIRENERKFAVLGQDPRRFKLAVFVIAAVFAGLAGALFAPFRGFASPEVMFWVLSGQALMMVIIGGIGTLIGPVLGAMVFLLIQEVLSSYTEQWMIFTGAIFVLMVIFLPGGLVGAVRTWLEGRASRPPARERRVMAPILETRALSPLLRRPPRRRRREPRGGAGRASRRSSARTAPARRASSISSPG